MTSTAEEYIVPFKNDEAKAKFRKWIGKNRGVSILHADWLYSDEGSFHTGCEAYKIKITNPKTVLLLLLTFPNTVTNEEAAKQNRFIWA